MTFSTVWQGLKYMTTTGWAKISAPTLKWHNFLTTKDIYFKFEIQLPNNIINIKTVIQIWSRLQWDTFGSVFLNSEYIFETFLLESVERNWRFLSLTFLYRLLDRTCKQVLVDNPIRSSHKVWGQANGVGTHKNCLAFQSIDLEGFHQANFYSTVVVTWSSILN